MKKVFNKRVMKYALLIFLAFNLLLIVSSFFIKVDALEDNTGSIIPQNLDLLTFDKSRNHQMITPNLYTTNLTTDEGYEGSIYKWNTLEEIVFDLDVKKSAKYYLCIDYKSLQTTVEDITINIDIDDKSNDKYHNINLPTYWADATQGTSERVYDIYQNEVAPTQVVYSLWRSYYLYDQRYYGNTPLVFDLSKGIHKFYLINNSGSLLLGNIYLVEVEEFADYEIPQTNEINKNVLTIEGESPLFKSSPDIAGSASQMTHLTPYSTSKNMINNLSGNTFNESGQSVTYAFEVKEAGYYKLGFKYYISQTNTSVYTKILIDNEIWYDTLNNYCFKNLKNNKAGSFDIETIKDENDDMLFYLDQGVHTLTIQLDASQQSSIYYELNSLIDEINELYLEVIKLTGGQKDKNISWNIDLYIPTARIRLNDWVARLETLLDYIEKVSKSDASKQNRLYQQVNNAYIKIKSIAKDPNKLPHMLNTLVDGASSASLMLSNSLHNSTFNPLSIDKIYIYGKDAKLDKVKGNFFKTYIATVQRVCRTTIDHTDDETVTIWVNRSTYYVSLMQQFADAYYTPTSGVKVRLSLLPDESKITYANASNTQPDAAFGVSSSVPYSLGIRGALANLHKFDTFGKTIKNIAPGSLLPLLEGDKVYGIPETQDFLVTFYREDILNELGISVPQTYDDIIEVVPTLQRYGMNYYMPLAGGSGLKGLGTTAPFFYQYGANMYSDDYFSVNIDSKEAIKAFTTMVDLFALYSLPLTTQNFYNNFRSGLSPVGMAGFDAYLQLANAAPEIVGKWHLDLCPGVEGDDGVINRTQTADCKTIVIFEKSKNQQAAWDFASWWMSTDVQTKFAADIQATYGATFLWNSANLEAFKQLAIPNAHKEVILKQLDWLYQVPQTPATYMVERGISNIWNTCVFDNASLRSSITNYSLEINREIKRKMVEFGYLNNKGVVLKPYVIPTIEDIKKWMEE